MQRAAGLEARHQQGDPGAARRQPRRRQPGAGSGATFTVRIPFHSETLKPSCPFRISAPRPRRGRTTAGPPCGSCSSRTTRRPRQASADPRTDRGHSIQVAAPSGKAWRPRPGPRRTSTPVIADLGLPDGSGGRPDARDHRPLRPPRHCPEAATAWTRTSGAAEAGFCLHLTKPVNAGPGRGDPQVPDGGAGAALDSEIWNGPTRPAMGPPPPQPDHHPGVEQDGDPEVHQPGHPVGHSTGSRYASVEKEERHRDAEQGEEDGGRWAAATREPANR